MLAYDYPLLGFFWSMLIFFLWVAWFMLLFRIIGDIFRRQDIGGGGKVLWCIFVIILPFLGVFIYVIVRGKSMSERDMAQAQAQNEAFRSYVQQTASTGSTADELAKLAGLMSTGAITQAEFDAAKGKILS